MIDSYIQMWACVSIFTWICTCACTCKFVFVYEALNKIADTMLPIIENKTLDMKEAQFKSFRNLSSTSIMH